MLIEERRKLWHTLIIREAIAILNTLISEFLYVSYKHTTQLAIIRTPTITLTLTLTNSNCHLSLPILLVTRLHLDWLMETTARGYTFINNASAKCPARSNSFLPRWRIFFSYTKRTYKLYTFFAKFSTSRFVSSLYFEPKKFFLLAKGLRLYLRGLRKREKIRNDMKRVVQWTWNAHPLRTPHYKLYNIILSPNEPFDETIITPVLSGFCNIYIDAMYRVSRISFKTWK